MGCCIVSVGCCFVVVQGVKMGLEMVGILVWLRGCWWFRVVLKLLGLFLVFWDWGGLLGLTTGPVQPEYSGFQSFSPGEHVNPFTGDFTYSIELGDVDGVFPLVLSYSSESVGWESEASWVGLGWNLNVGALQRVVNGLPDDACGDSLVEQRSMKDRVRVGLTLGIKGEFWGLPVSQMSLHLIYDNYDGISLGRSMGIEVGPVWLSVGFQSGVGPSVTFRYSYSQEMLRDAKGRGGFTASRGITWSPGSYSMYATTSWSHTIVRQGEGKDEYSTGLPSLYWASGQYVLPGSSIPSWGMGFRLSFKPGQEFFGIEPLYVSGASFTYRRFYKKPLVFRSYGYLYLHEGVGKRGARLDYMRDGGEGYTPGQPWVSPVYLTPDMYMVGSFGLSLQFRAQRRHPGTVYPQRGYEYGLGGGDMGLGRRFLDRFLDFLFGRDELESQIGVGVESGGGNTGKVGLNLSVDMNSSGRGSWLALEEELPRFRSGDVFWKVLDGGALVDSQRLGVYGGVDKYYVVTLRDRDFRVPHGVFPSYYRHELAQPFAIQAYTVGQCRSLWNSTFSVWAKPHHIGRFEIVNSSGMRYIFSRPLYQWTKQVTFRVEHDDRLLGEPRHVYYALRDASGENRRGNDHLYTYQRHPAYAYAYLPTAILGASYIDRNGNGPDTADLGWWARLSYTPVFVYRWRDPVGYRKANYSPGEFFRREDGTASYTYGEKEVAYLREIETPYMRVRFVVSDREDGLGVIDEHGGVDGSVRLKKLDKMIFERRGEGGGWFRYREVRFEYDYSLAKGTPNSLAGGRLTLRKVRIIDFDIYGGFETGVKEYSFSYWYEDEKYKPDAFVDRWGVYSGGLSWRSRYATQSEVERNKYVSLWKLKRVRDPYGLVMEIEYETDRYMYVQDKRAYRMYRIEGYSDLGGGRARLRVNIGRKVTTEVEEMLFGQIWRRDDSLIYIRIPVNLLNDPGQAKNFSFIEVFGKYVSHSVDQDSIVVVDVKNPVRSLLSGQINPIQLAAINYVMHHATDQAYPDIYSALNSLVDEDGDPPSLTALFTPIGAQIANLVGGARGVMLMLKMSGVGGVYLPGGSVDAVVRLGSIGERLGGGARVRRITYYTLWEQDTVRHVLEYRYGMGVASFEPLFNHEENPLAMPVFYRWIRGGGVLTRLFVWSGMMSDPVYFRLGPLMRSMYPSAGVGYSWVEVWHKTPAGVHSTGRTRYEYYTYREYPVVEKYSPISSGRGTYVQKESVPFSPLSLVRYRRVYIAVSQGHLLITHNMHGKLRRKVVYDGSGRVVREEVYRYRSGVSGVAFAGSDGWIKRYYSGVDMDFVFYTAEYVRESMSASLRLNVGGSLLPLGVPLIVFLGLGSFGWEGFRGRVVVATKRVYIHYFVELVEVRDRNQWGYERSWVYDLTTGEPLVQEVGMSLGSPPVYRLRLPAYWFYPRMGSAHNREGVLLRVATDGEGKVVWSEVQGDVLWYRDEGIQGLVPGDELVGSGGLRVWVVEDEWTGELYLVDRRGEVVRFVEGEFIRVRSGRRNLLGLEVGEVRTLTDPVRGGRLGVQSGDSVLDVVVRTYSDRWQMPCGWMCSPVVVETLEVGKETYGGGFSQGHGRGFWGVVEGVHHGLEWVSNVVGYGGGRGYRLPDSTVSVSSVGGKTLAGLVLGRGLSWFQVYRLDSAGKRLEVFVPGGYRFLDGRVRWYGGRLYVLGLVSKRGVGSGLDTLLLVLMGVSLGLDSVWLIGSYRIGFGNHLSGFVNVRVSDPGVMSYVIRTGLGMEHIVGSLSVFGQSLYVVRVVRRVFDAVWRGWSLEFLTAGGGNTVLERVALRDSVFRVWIPSCYSGGGFVPGLFSGGRRLADAQFIWSEGGWQVLWLGRSGVVGRLFMVPVWDSGGVRVWTVNGVSDLYPVLGEGVLPYTLVSRGNEVYFFPLFEDLGCVDTLVGCGEVVWQLTDLPVGGELVDVELDWLPVGSREVRRSVVVSGVNLRSGLCGCSDSAVVVVRHAGSCCGGSIVVRPVDPEVRLLVWSEKGLVVVDTGRQFSQLCAGLYVLEPVGGRCRWRVWIGLDGHRSCVVGRAGMVNPYVEGLRGRWQVVGQYVWRGRRSPVDTGWLTGVGGGLRIPHVRYSGGYWGWSSFLKDSGGTLVLAIPLDSGWVEVSRVTQMGLWGEPVEEVDMLGRYSSALYGYFRHLPVQVVMDSRLRNIVFLSFEEWEVLRSHVRMDSVALQVLGGRRTSRWSHTGYHSLYVPGGDSFSLRGMLVRRVCPLGGLARGVPFRVSGCDCLDGFSPEGGKEYVYYAWVRWFVDTVRDTVCVPVFGGVQPVSGSVARVGGGGVGGGVGGGILGGILGGFWRWRLSVSWLPMRCRVFVRYEERDPGLRLVVWYTDSLGVRRWAVHRPEYVSGAIEGWRLYRWRFRFPASCGSYGFRLEGRNGYGFWIDDVRIEPVDSRSEAYVYDPGSLRLVARFGFAHGATMYRYDERGYLSGVLQEVERGLFGVSHRRQVWRAK